MNKSLEAFQRLLDIMDRLRVECPWDKKQTIESLRHLTIEEVFELSQAIVDEDYQDVKKELGDIIMHIVFYSRIAQDRNLFTIDDVINGICEKLIVRHPHVFGDTSVKSAEEVADNWEKIKLTKEQNRSVLGGVPNALPELVKAYRMQEKAAGVGFDWENKEQVWEKVEEEIRELKEVIGEGNGGGNGGGSGGGNGDGSGGGNGDGSGGGNGGGSGDGSGGGNGDGDGDGGGKYNKERVTEEFGDLMFALVNYSRFIKVNPMDALEVANKKFRKRFSYVEDKAREAGRSLVDMSLDEMNELWDEAKAEL